MYDDYRMFTRNGNLSQWAIDLEKNYGVMQRRLKILALVLKAVMAVGMIVFLISIINRFDIAMILSLFISFVAYMYLDDTLEHIAVNRYDYKNIRKYRSIKN